MTRCSITQTHIRKLKPPVSLLLLFSLVSLLLLGVPTLSARRAGGQASKKQEQVQEAPPRSPEKISKKVSTLPGEQKRYALVIGVNKYQELSELGGAVNDAKLLADALWRFAGFPKEQVFLLTSDQPDERKPTRGNILGWLANIRKILPPDGNAMLLIAFAGHGTEHEGQAFLLPSDARTGDAALLEDTALSVDLLKKRILATGVKQVVIILDSCRNDPDPDGTRTSGDVLLPESLPRELDFNKLNKEVEAFAVIFSTSVNKSAYENKGEPEKRHGYFTLELVEGLREKAANKDGEVTLSSLIEYVEEQVPKKVMQELGKEQKPFHLSGGYRENKLVIALTTPMLKPETLKAQPFERELTNDKPHKYVLPVVAGQFMRIEIAQRGVDVRASLTGPDGKQIAEADSFYDSQVPITLMTTAEAGGNYRLEVRPSGFGESAGGRYQIRVEELRPIDRGDANQKGDSERLAGQRSLLTGNQLRRDRNDLAGALKKYDEAREQWKAAGFAQGEARALRYQGDIYDKMGEKEKALETYRQALIPLKVVRDRTGEAFTLVIMSQISLSLGKQKEASEYLDQVKSALQANRQSDLDRSYAEIANRLTSIEAERRLLAARERRSAEEEKRLALLNQDWDLANRYFEKTIETLIGGTANGVSDAERLQSVLRKAGENAVALYTMIAEDKYYVIMVTADTRKVFEYPIKAVELKRKILEFREVLERPGNDPLPLAREMYRILLGPVEKDLQASKAKLLLWSLDGPLRYMPVAALHDGQKYLVERYQNAIITPASLPLVQDPAVNKGRVLALGASKATPQFAPLPGVAAELQSIVRAGATSSGVAPGTILLDEAFTQENMLHELRHGYSVVHIASHFALLPGNSSDSYVQLGDGTHLTLAQIKNLPGVFTGVDLLVLSSANTAVNLAEADGREVEGLSLVAQRQGAKAVISTLWPIHDLATADLMRKFYATWYSNTGTSKAEALQQAQLSLLLGTARVDRPRPDSRGMASQFSDDTSPASASTQYRMDTHRPFAHPFYWAPFVLVGNWR